MTIMTIVMYMQYINCYTLQGIGPQVVVSETKNISEFHRQFTSTLFICGTSKEVLGYYECLLHRARKDGKDIPIWSTTLSRSEGKEKYL